MMSTEYQDLLCMQRPESGRQKMDLSNRAKIFSPFAALRGYEKILKTKEKMRVNRSLLSEEEGAEIDRKLRTLKKGDWITVTSFCEDPGPDGSGGMAEGEYQTTSGVFSRIDKDTCMMWIGDTGIYIENIFRIHSIQALGLENDDFAAFRLQQ